MDRSVLPEARVLQDAWLNGGHLSPHPHCLLCCRSASALPEPLLPLCVSDKPTMLTPEALVKQHVAYNAKV